MRLGNLGDNEQTEAQALFAPFDSACSASASLRLFSSCTEISWANSLRVLVTLCVDNSLGTGSSPHTVPK